MNTGLAIILTAYLIGYFMSYGILLSQEDDPITFDTLVGFFVMSFLSWVIVGIYLGDLTHKSTLKTGEDEKG